MHGDICEATGMKGILFKPWKIQFIAEHPDMEIMTRRLGGLKLINREPDKWGYVGKVLASNIHNVGGFLFELKTKEDFIQQIAKPRYQQGETVYIKEKALYWDGGAGGRSNYAYADDPEIPHLLEDNNRLLVARETANIVAGEPVVGKWKWRSPMMMPEWAARHFIKVVAVRAERLQEINPDNKLDRINFKDLCAEGWLTQVNEKERVLPFGSLNEQGEAMQWYRELWNSINKDYQWESNPFIWVYTFALMERR